MASSAAPTTRPLPAISVGALPRSSTSRVSQRRDYRVAAVTSGSAALPSVMAASTPRSGSRSMSGSTGRSRIGHLVYTNAYPGHSETGLRGLTTVPSPSGHGEVLLAAVEGNAARIVRVDPRDGSEATELNLADFLVQRWGMRAGYVIAAYNNMAKIRDPGGGEALLIGLEAFIPLSAPVTAGHNVVNVGYGRLEAGGWYLVRRSNGHFDLGQIPAGPGRALVAIRSIRASPFPQERDALYFAGYDANKAPAHNTAWIFRSTLAAVIGTAR